MDKAEKVVRRHMQAIVFESKEQMDRYMRDHPDADRSNHSVRHKDSTNPKDYALSANSVRALKRLKKEPADLDGSHMGYLRRSGLVEYKDGEYHLTDKGKKVTDNL